MLPSPVARGLVQRRSVGDVANVSQSAVGPKPTERSEGGQLSKSLPMGVQSVAFVPSHLHQPTIENM
jgi:hypothetical protein